MAESERLKGNRSPVTDYKIGNGGVKDLFKYLMGDSATRKSMKVVKTRNGKTTVVRNGNQKDVIGDNVRKVVVNSSNDVSRMAGDRARNIQRNMAARMNQRVEPARVTGEDQTNRMRMMATYPGAVQDDRGPTAMVEPVDVQELPEAPMMSPMMSEEELQARLDAKNPDSEILKERTIRVRDGSPPEYRAREGFPPEYSMGSDTIGKFYMGGKVKTKKKKKKKLAKGGKVTSYNY
jgi:hypothetical protein